MIKRSENHEALISGANQKPHISICFFGDGLRLSTTSHNYKLHKAIRRMDISWANKLSRRIRDEIQKG